MPRKIDGARARGLRSRSMALARATSQYEPAGQRAEPEIHGAGRRLLASHRVATGPPARSPRSRLLAGPRASRPQRGPRPAAASRLVPRQPLTPSAVATGHGDEVRGVTDRSPPTGPDRPQP